MRMLSEHYKKREYWTQEEEINICIWTLYKCYKTAVTYSPSSRPKGKKEILATMETGAEKERDGSLQSTMETGAEEEKKQGTKQKGGIKTMPFIFANEITEKLAVIGFSSNMITYLTQQLHMPLTKAAITITNFGGTASLTPLVGAFLSDAYIGRFWTIAVASIIYQLGMITLTTSAIFPQFRPPPCTESKHQSCQEAAPWQLGVLYLSLFLNSLGAGGIRPCIVAFGADQFDEFGGKRKTKTWNFFNWYYFSMGVAMLLAVTVVVYIQENVGWGWGLGVPTIAMAISVVAFIIGYPLYRRLEPSGSPFTRIVQVVAAAVRKRKLPPVTEPQLLYQNDALDAPISLAGKLQHTDQFRFLDKAAIVTESDGVKDGEAKTDTPIPNLWRLSTVHRVEELKSVLRMGPIWAAGIIAAAASAQQHTFTIQQARSMERHLSPNFQIPPASLSVFTTVTMLVTITLYDRVLIRFLRRFTGLERGLSLLQRMGVGFAVTVIANIVAGFVEAQRLRTAQKYGLVDSPEATVPMSVFWLVPQYAIHGVGEAFATVGHLEFLYDQAPESMRSTATAFFSLSTSIGSYLSSLIVTLVHKYTAGPDGSDWLPTNINKGKLDYFYWLVAVLQFFNFLYYILCTKIYTYKKVQIQEKGRDGEVELNGQGKAEAVELALNDAVLSV